VSMPIKKQTMVISRYLYSVGILVIVLFIEWIGTNISYSSTFEPYTFIDFLMLFAVALVLFAICYPILYFVNNSYVVVLILFILLITKHTMVISRYLYSVGILVIIHFIEWIGTNISYSSTFEPYTFIDFLMLFAVGLVLFAICYPILYFFNNSYVAMLIIFL